MKKFLLVTAFAFTISANAQSTNNVNTSKKKMYYSFAWGLFRSKNYPKNKLDAIKSSKQNSKIIIKNDLDRLNYEEKSILWGAIQWTEKKKNVSSTKSEYNGK
jgi:hypothetical protein